MLALNFSKIMNAPDVETGSSVESFAIQAVEQISPADSITGGERDFFDSLDDGQKAAYDTVKVLNVALTTERLGNKGTEAEGAYRGTIEDGKSSSDDAAREAMLERVRAGINAMVELKNGGQENVKTDENPPAQTSELAPLHRAVIEDNDFAQLEGVIALGTEQLRLADMNEQSGSFKIARALTWVRTAYSGIRSMFGGKLAESGSKVVHKLSNGLWGSGGGAKAATAVGMVGGGVGLSYLLEGVPIVGGVFAGIGAGFTTQRALYRYISNSELRRDDTPAWSLGLKALGEYGRHLFAPDSSRGEKRGWVIGPLQRALSPIYTTRNVMVDRLIKSDDIYRLGVDVRKASDAEQRDQAMGRVEQLTAILQNRIDERQAAGETIMDNDPEYSALIAALQVMAMDTVHSDKKIAVERFGMRTAGLTQGYQHVEHTRRVALTASVAAGTAVGLLVGKAAEAAAEARRIAEDHHNAAESHEADSTQRRVEEVDRRAAAAAPAAKEVVKRVATPEATKYPETISTTARTVFGTTEHTGSVDVSYNEHLVRLDLARTLGADRDHNGILTSADFAHLKTYGVTLNDQSQLDFNGITAAGRTLVNNHLNALEQAAKAAEAGTASTDSMTEPIATSLTSMQRAHLDHEAMTILGQEFEINNLDRLRELRWTSQGTQSAHEMFAEQQRLIDHLLVKGNRTFTFDGHVIDLDKLDVPNGASHLDRVRAALKMFAKIKHDNISAADLAVRSAAEIGGTGAPAKSPAAPVKGDKTVTPTLEKTVPDTQTQPAAEIRTGTASDKVGEMPGKPDNVQTLEASKTSTATGELPTAPAEPVATLEQARQRIESIGADQVNTDHDVPTFVEAPKPPVAAPIAPPVTPPATVTPVVPPRLFEGPSVSTPNVDLSKLPPLDEAKPVE